MASAARYLPPDPGLAVVPPGLTAAEGALDLVPVPAALVGCRDGAVVREAVNEAFEAAALDDGLRRLAGRLGDFLDRGDARDAFEWQAGDAVEQRLFRVTLARIANRREPRALACFVDVTGESRARANLAREMTTDSLTGLPNRAGFLDRIEAHASEDQRFAVLVVDLDRFSRVNACLGGLAGDELLITVARRIRGALRGGDALARIGGDEFGILLAIDEAQGEAELAGRRIADALTTPFRLGGYEIRVDCSVGIAFGGEGGDAEDVIRHAQFAMKRAKTSGRAESYQTQAFDVARERFATETALRRAIDARRLTLHYQPISDLSTGRMVALEALARWTTDDGREVPPSEFVPVAEESGLIVPLGRWAIDEATRTLATFDARRGGDCGIAVAVNLSPIQLQRDRIAPVVERALAASGLAGDRLKLELTESALVADPDRVAETLHALKALGATIAMDDFGTGYSNLAYLQRLPIDVLKIDRSFVTGMLADRDKIAIVRAILSLAQALGMKTVAEGVETVEVGQTLAALGCTFGQGYAYGRPVDADAAYALLVAANG